MSDLTPATLDELRRRAEACPMPDNDPDILREWYAIDDLTERNYPIPPIDAAFIAAASPNVVLGLLDAATERDRLARLLDEPRRSGCAVEISGVRIAPCDERGQTADMRAADSLRRELAHMTEARDNARAEVERLTALVEAVRALHQPAGRHNFCGTCAYAPWPCATYRALDAAPETGGES